MDVINGYVSVFVAAQCTLEGDVGMDLLTDEEAGVPPAVSTRTLLRPQFHFSRRVLHVHL